jgi:cytochrome c-type biogenesis protein CcmH
MPKVESSPAGSRKAFGALLLLLCLALCAGTALPAAAREAAPATADPALEAKVMRIATELRCLVCQNETIAASHADLAVDLRNQVREMLRQGRSEAEIMTYMTDRYGDFVLYRPPVKPTTWVLWYGPAALLVGGVVALFLVLRRRSRLGADAFEPERDDDPGLTGGPAPRG